LPIYLHLCAERRLRERDRHGDGEIAVAPAEQRVRFDARDHVEIAVGAAVAARGAATLQPDALAVTDPRRDADLDLPGPQLGAAALAGRARLIDDRACPAALGAHLAEREVALVLVEHAPTAAPWARVWCRPRFGAGAVTRVTGHLAREVDRGGHTLDRAEEGQLQLGLEVGTALRAGAARLATAAPAAPEQVAEEITEVTEVVGGEGEVATAARTAEPAGHRPEAARFVVLLALRL